MCSDICFRVQAVCAIPTKMFDSVVNEMLLNDTEATSEGPELILPSRGDMAALGFLDAYFKGIIGFVCFKRYHFVYSKTC